MKALLFATIAVLALTVPAAAVDLNQKLTTIDGKDFVGPDGKPVDITMGTIIEGALVSAPATTEAEKNQNYWLAIKVRKNYDNFQPTPDDIIAIRKALAATQNTAVYGQTMSVLDPTFMKDR